MATHDNGAYDKPHELDLESVLAYCETNRYWAEAGEMQKFRILADATKESMQGWFHDQTEAAYDNGYEAGYQAGLDDERL